MERLGKYLVLVGGLVGVLVTVALLTLPLMQYCGLTFADAANNGMAEVRCAQSNLIESQGGRLEVGTWIYLGVMTGLSVVIGGMAWRAIRGASLNPFLVLGLDLILGFGVVIAGFSIGGFYAAGAGLIAVGAVLGLLFRDQNGRRAVIPTA